MFKESWRIALNVNRLMIDALDSLMMKMLFWRMGICRRIGRTKISHNLPVFVPEREKEILKKRQAQGARMGFSERFVRIFTKAVMSESKRIQKGLSGI